MDTLVADRSASAVLTDTEVTSFGTYTITRTRVDARVDFLSADGNVREASPLLHIAEIDTWIVEHNRIVSLLGI